ncbi:MAG: SDR family NAD(P)-dependent oxidoreductase [Alphaproteobacteria bacterium]|nr:SDR family NAD(P)-dependent oxidoreductase [Alphaproteobacteria bacterium]
MSQPTRHGGAVRATLAGIVDRFTPRGPGVRLDPTVRLDGQTALVTGASRGLGLAIAQGLAHRGARLILPCRSGHAEAEAAVLAVAPEAQVELLDVDLASPASVEALCDTLRDRGERLDLLVCNAGVVPARARTTPAGLDLMVHVNFLANVQLVRRLLDDGTLPRDRQPPARIVLVGSEAHRSAPPIDPDRWDRAEDYGTAAVIDHYGRSKLLLHAWVCELARRLDGPDGPQVAVHHLCPGAVASSIAREAPGWVKPLLDLLMRTFFASPAKASLPALYLAAEPTLDGRTGVYLHLDRARDVAATASDPEVGATLWDAAGARVLAWRSGP